jgi:hypothetical protein
LFSLYSAAPLAGTCDFVNLISKLEKSSFFFFSHPYCGSDRENEGYNKESLTRHLLDIFMITHNFFTSHATFSGKRNKMQVEGVGKKSKKNEEGMRKFI